MLKFVGIPLGVLSCGPDEAGCQEKSCCNQSSALSPAQCAISISSLTFCGRWLAI
jgi:hypothetical protein